MSPWGPGRGSKGCLLPKDVPRARALGQVALQHPWPTLSCCRAEFVSHEQEMFLLLLLVLPGFPSVVGAVTHQEPSGVGGASAVPQGHSRLLSPASGWPEAILLHPLLLALPQTLRSDHLNPPWSRSQPGPSVQMNFLGKLQSPVPSFQAPRYGI